MMKVSNTGLSCLGLTVLVSGIMMGDLNADPIHAQKLLRSVEFQSGVTRIPASIYKTGGYGNWSAAQATGAPNTKSAGDHVTAWASRTQDEQKEWLELTYDKPVTASTIMIYETYNPGAISKVEFWKSDNKGSGFWVGDVGVVDQPKRILMVPVPANFGEFDRVKLHLDSPAVQGWNEIDAVGLLDTDGKTHWAKSAKASSSYADRYTSISYVKPVNTGTGSEVQKLKSEIDQLKKRIEKLEKILNFHPTQGIQKPATETSDPTPSKRKTTKPLPGPPAVEFFSESKPEELRPVKNPVRDGDGDAVSEPLDPPETSEPTE